MKYIKIYILTLASSFVFAQIPVLKGQDRKQLQPPAKDIKEGALRIGRKLDYTQERLKDGTWFIWSLQDHAWVDATNISPCIATIKGPLTLPVGAVQDYQIAARSGYKGVEKELWGDGSSRSQSAPGFKGPHYIGQIYFEDGVEIDWEVRVSSGIRLLKCPQPPKSTFYAEEPIIATLQIELTSPNVQHIEIYFNAFHGGKLVGMSSDHIDINDGVGKHSGLDDTDSIPYNRLRPLNSWDIENEQRRAAEHHRPNGLNPGEFLKDTLKPEK